MIGSQVRSADSVALLVMDLQEGIVALSKSAESLVTNAARAIASARSTGILVVHVHVAFRPGYPEIGSSNSRFLALKRNNLFQHERAHTTVAPSGNEIVVTKRRVNAFYGTDLDTILRANRVESLFLCGFATSGVVLSTLRDASDRDYEISVLRDCCDDMDQSVHDCLMNSVFPTQARVVTSKEFSGGSSANTWLSRPDPL